MAPSSSPAKSAAAAGRLRSARTLIRIAPVCDPDHLPLSGRLRSPDAHVSEDDQREPRLVALDGQLSMAGKRSDLSVAD